MNGCMGLDEWMFKGWMNGCMCLDEWMFEVG